ncbi:MAG: hypothetical protein V2I47_12935 [Bacteroidales bacterium]|jgi:hypothetical protein|nr:hypothetical protein [Bacteroidales bacterium]
MAKTETKDLLPDIAIFVDQFNENATAWLEQGIRTMDRAYSEWEKKYHLLAGEVLTLYKDTGTGVPIDDKSKHAGESAVKDLISHISGFRGYSISGFLDTAVVPSSNLLALESIPGEILIDRPLEKEFWLKDDRDSRSIRMARRWYFIRLRSGIDRRTKKKYRGIRWGIQQYHPRLLVTAYYAIPLLRKIIHLLEKRQQEHARRFNYLHLAHEKELKGLISLAAKSIYQDGDVPALDIGSKDFESNGIALTPVRDILKVFKANTEDNLHALERNSMLAGTLLLKEEVFNYDANSKTFRKTIKDQNRSSEEWQAYFEGEGSDWAKDLEIISLQMQTVLIARAIQHQITSKVNKDILPLIGNFLSLVKGSFEEIKAAENSPEFRDKILKESRQGLRDLRLKTIPNLVDAFNKAQILKTLNNFTSQVIHRFNALDTGYSILQRLDLENIPPLLGTRQINLKKIIDKEHLSGLKDHSLEFSTTADQSLGDILRTLNEIGHMIQVNLEAALELIDREDTREWKKADAGKVVSDSLDRIYSNIEKLNSTCRNIPVEWSKEISDIAFHFIAGINELLDNENITDLVFRQAKAEASKRYTTIRQQLSTQTRNILLKAWGVITFGLSGAQSRYMKLSKMTGIISDLEHERELMHFLYTTDRKIEELPYIYQRLFRLQALSDASIFNGRTQELERLVEDYSLWKAGKFASLAIVGKKGSGRTSLLNIASASVLKNTALFRINLPKGIQDEVSLAEQFKDVVRSMGVKDLNELEQALKELSTPVIVVIENLHNIFIRTVNGFEMIERFLLLVSRTPGKVFWIVSCGIYLWNYLEKTISIRRYFYDVIELGELDNEKVREIIMKRHRLSGYELEFMPGEIDKADKQYKRLGSDQEKQEFLEREFFSDLDSHSQGNISVALLLWLLSVEEIEPNKVVISNDIEHDTSFLSMLPEDELFTLEAIVEIEVLTIAEHAEIFNLEEWASEMILLRLKNKGLLFRSGEGFQIHLLLYEQIVKMLDDKNILK